MIDRWRNSNALDVQSLKAADCDNDTCLLVTKAKERQALNKQRQHRFHVERFSLKNVNEIRG
jgi:phosphoribosyl-AMP cyclohydrolase